MLVGISAELEVSTDLSNWVITLRSCKSNMGNGRGAVSCESCSKFPWFVSWLLLSDLSSLIEGIGCPNIWWNGNGSFSSSKGIGVGCFVK